MKKLKDLVIEAQKLVIDDLSKLNFEILEINRRYFQDELKKLWGEEKVHDKFDSNDIFGFPLATAYLLYCYPKLQLIAVIRESDRLCEYWDFYLENFPDIKFDANIESFYEAVKERQKR